jgi:hypothetical protein
MVALAIIGILSVFGMQAMLQNQKGSRMNQFDNEVNSAMAEITRLVTDPFTCTSSFMGLGPGTALFTNPRTSWTRVPRLIYDVKKPPTGSNLIAVTFPTAASEPPPAFRGSKILGIRSAYLVPRDYPNYNLQTTLGAGNTGNAFVEFTFEYIGPPNTMIGLRTRTKVLPLSVTWGNSVSVVAGMSEAHATKRCEILAKTGCPSCEYLVEECNSTHDTDLVTCMCIVSGGSIDTWRILQCNSVSGT